MSPGLNKRSTGTVPKSKLPKKNGVPHGSQETRRDLQQHLNVSYF